MHDFLKLGNVALKEVRAQTVGLQDTNVLLVPSCRCIEITGVSFFPASELDSATARPA
jgi:hypothetical protein